MILVSKFLVPKGYAGIALYPFIFLRSSDLKHRPKLCNHERIHLRQQAELLVFFFYLWYVLEFLMRWLKYRDRHRAYRQISFEREAYANEGDLKYLADRKIWQFIMYF